MFKKAILVLILILVGFHASISNTYATGLNFDLCKWLGIGCQPQCIWECNPVPSPTPSPEEEATPSSVPLTQGGEGCSEDCGGESHPAECTGIPPKPATPIAWSPLDDGITAHWAPSTDPHDYQLMIFGNSPDNMPYGIPKLDANASEVDLHTGFAETWWSVGTVHNECTSWSTPFDGGM